MEWTSAAGLAFRLGKGGYDHRYTLQKYWTVAKAYLDLGKTQIVVTGHSNVGKTLLVAQMDGRARDLAYEIPQESYSVEVEAIPLGEWTKLIRVLPGQTGRRTHGEIEAFWNNDQLEGVIHVVDFGFTKPRDTISIQAFIKQGIDSIEKLKAHNLSIEIQHISALLSDLRKSIKKNNAPKWLIIAVNKVDLFPEDRQAALEFYHPSGSSDFSKVLNDFTKEIGSNNFSIFVIQTCAHETDFEWNKETISSRLEKKEQITILREFVKSVAIITQTNA